MHAAIGKRNLQTLQTQHSSGGQQAVSKRETHVFRCPDRTCTLTIRECKDHIRAGMTLSRYGWSRLEDFEAFEAWFKPLVARYGNDPRPVVMRHPLTGQHAIIGCNEKRAALAVLSPIGQHKPRA